MHVDDVARAISHLYGRTEISGPVNLTAPGAVTNAEMMAQVRPAMGRQWGVPLPDWTLEAGAHIIRTEAELVLKSRWIESPALKASGLSFA